MAATEAAGSPAAAAAPAAADAVRQGFNAFGQGRGLRQARVDSGNGTEEPFEVMKGVSSEQV